jgi:signal transduction histidine kinase
VVNLLSNAIKYGAGCPIDVSLRRQGDEAVLEVSDRGPGISGEDLIRIFERFERAASVRKYGGLGLGLYVAREVAVAHGGTVTVDNRSEGGVCFRVGLPLLPLTDPVHAPLVEAQR